MTRDELLAQLGWEVSGLGDDYNESLEGYFGGEIDGDVLVLTFTPYDDEGKPCEESTAKWRLVPVEGD